MDFTETRLKDRVLLLLQAPWSETMTILDAGSGLIVVDTWGSLAAAKQAKIRTVFIPELGIVFGRWEFSDPGKLVLEPKADPAIIVRVLEEILTAGKPIRYLIPGHGSPVENPDLRSGIARLKEMGPQ